MSSVTTPAAAPEVVEDIVDERIEQIEDKVEVINQRATSATADAHRAEALLVGRAMVGLRRLRRLRRFVLLQRAFV